jgi:integrase
MAKRRSHGQGTLFRRGDRSPWIASWHTYEGRRVQRSTRTTDRTAAERILRKHVADAALRREGVIDASAELLTRQARRPIADHLTDWQTRLESKNVTAKHVRYTLSMARRVIESTKAKTLADLTPAGVMEAITARRTAGAALQTTNATLQAVKSFTRWAFRDRRLIVDPLAGLTGHNAATDRRLERRALTVDELSRLIETTANGPKRQGWTGPDRSMLYRVAAGTGFRAKELRSLTPASFDLDATQPAITVSASNSKRRRDDRQPIRADLACRIRSWLAGKPQDGPVFRATERAGAMLKADLRLSRARWIKETHDPTERRARRAMSFLSVEDESGRVVDFHALRTTYITMLVKGGAPVKVAQELARHCDPRLTMNVYTKLGIHDLADALDALPGDTPQEPIGQASRATGTDHAHADNAKHPQQYPQQKCQQYGRERVQSNAPPRDDTEAEHVPSDRGNLRIDAAICNAAQSETPPDQNTHDRIRTCDLRIRSPLLYPTELRGRGWYFTGLWVLVCPRWRWGAGGVNGTGPQTPAVAPWRSRYGGRIRHDGPGWLVGSVTGGAAAERHPCPVSDRVDGNPQA